MLVNAETTLHRFCARILGWTADREVSVEHAISSIELATDHRAAFVLLNLRLIADARRRAEDAAPAVAPMERAPDAQEDAT